MNYHADVREAETRDGMFEARFRDRSIIVVSREPEHDLCDAMIKARLPDGSIQFWRGEIQSISFKSVHRAAGVRFELGEKFPYRRVRRREGAPSDFEKSRCGVRQHGRFEVGQYQTATEGQSGCTDPCTVVPV